MNRNQLENGSGKKYFFPEINYARGIGIVFVVLGHALKQTGTDNQVFQILLSVIYSFHMPLFFLLAGFVAVSVFQCQTAEKKKAYIQKRAMRLLVPYFVIGVIYLPLKYVLSQYAVKAYDFSSVWKLFLGENPNVSLWFLYTLFWISVICVLFVRREYLVHAVIISCAAAAVVLGTGTDIRVLQYLFYFLAGLWLREHYDYMQLFIRNGKMQLVCAAVFAVGNVLLYLSGLQVIKLATALSGCTLCLAVSSLMAERENAAVRLFEHLGTYSMDIYIISEPVQTCFKIVLFSILKMPYLLCTAGCFLLGLFLPIPLSCYIVRRVKLFRILFLGLPAEEEKSKRKK